MCCRPCLRLPAIAAVATFLACAGMRGATAASMRVRLWQPAELALRTRTTPARPFETEVSAVARGPEGQQLEVPALYDGGGTYRLRFTAPSAGRWTLTTTSPGSDLISESQVVEVAPSGEHPGPLISPWHPVKTPTPGRAAVLILRRIAGG